MDILGKIETWFKSLGSYLKAETELVRLKLIKKVSSAVADLFSFIFILFLSVIVLAFLYICLGFWLSSWLNSFSLGFGVALLVAIVQLVVMVAYRKQILLPLFTNIAIKQIMGNQEFSEDEDQKQ